MALRAKRTALERLKEELVQVGEALEQYQKKRGGLENRMGI